MWCVSCNINECELHLFYRRLKICSLNKQNNKSTFNRICVDNISKKFLRQTYKI